MTGLLGPQKSTSLLQLSKLGRVLCIHRRVMNFANVLLHISINNTRPDRQRRDRRLLDRQRQGEMIKRGFTCAIRAPGRVSIRSSAGRAQDDAALGLAQRGEAGFDLDRTPHH